MKIGDKILFQTDSKYGEWQEAEVIGLALEVQLPFPFNDGEAETRCIPFSQVVKFPEVNK